MAEVERAAQHRIVQLDGAVHVAPARRYFGVSGA